MLQLQYVYPNRDPLTKIVQINLYPKYDWALIIHNIGINSYKSALLRKNHLHLYLQKNLNDTLYTLLWKSIRNVFRHQNWFMFKTYCIWYVIKAPFLSQALRRAMEENRSDVYMMSILICQATVIAGNFTKKQSQMCHVHKENHCSKGICCICVWNVFVLVAYVII